ncbi:MAG: hypothetical protein E5V72_01490 [Mesorhizobium sp.]|uniref:hypothetical protein n=1 Tax=Mesorhizobium sp. TaxID=1871066 RepID=UPI000FE9C6B5|nr:hypothetical protein [Mesorhizobium sp.]RWH50261.1 MAG: hypothetical protein EOQ80_04630 [Mesorhizobium sp.]RWH52273.1 MAG: hypothetical protein EOQ82_26615 [Mesorhizobium sp.]RWI69694.1 MAG: hypothetical protein EOR18_20920 [Mesorhizobium sp.]RWI76161.1 MAG: hypothetical protein EOR19_18510 [Mesorhizobium sp.]RWJ33231.1 MAG: hypothetical protein EOR28_11640 [Mesorhizobium sp.]
MPKYQDIVAELIRLYEDGYNDGTLTSTLKDYVERKDKALRKAESFISGFEDCEMQEGVPALLQEIRNASA